MNIQTVKPPGGSDNNHFLQAIQYPDDCLEVSKTEGVLRCRGCVLQTFHLLTAYGVYVSAGPMLLGPYL